MRTLDLKEETGQATIFVAVAMMLFLFGFVGLATDIGVMFHVRRNMQIAADSAAIAGASEFNFSAIDGISVQAAGQAGAAQNGAVNGVNGVVVTINNGPSSGPYAGNPNYVEAIVTQTQPTFFAQVLNILSMNVSARAVATLGPGGCIYTLSPTGSALTFNGLTVNLATCPIVDASADPAALTANSGTITASQIGVVGGYTNGGATVNPTPITPIASFDDPLAYLIPPAFAPANCLPDPQPITTTTLVPGCYNGLTINPPPGNAVTINLTPGIYIIDGVLTLPSPNAAPTSIIGTGITFYFPTAPTMPPGATSNLVDGGAEIWNVTAPTAAPLGGGDFYNGVLFYQDPSDTLPLAFNSGNNSTLEGIVYAPTASVTITNDGTATLYESVDAASLTLGGTGTLQNYNTINNASVLTAAKLVE